jgi:hypothetical protein
MIGIRSNSNGIGVDAFGKFEGVEAFAAAHDDPGGAYGVYAYATEDEHNIGSRYEVSGSAWGGQSNYGIYGWAGSESFNAAGYFAGDVYATNYYFTSDRKMKTAINPLQNSLQQLMKLKPATFQFKTTDYPQMGLPRNKQMG